MAENNLIETGHLVYAKGHTIAARSNLLTAIAKNGIVGAIRNVGPEEVVVDQIEQFFLTTTPAAAAGPLAFAVYKVIGFSALTNAGARGTAPVPIRKRNTEFSALLPAVDAAVATPSETSFLQVQISDTAALTGGTFTAPAFDDPLAPFVVPTSSVGTTVMFNGQGRWTPHDWIPYTLGANEGLVFASQQAFPGSLVGVYGFAVDVHLA